MEMDKTIAGQTNKVMVWLMKYYPVRIKNVRLARRIRSEKTDAFKHRHSFPFHDIVRQFLGKHCIDVCRPKIYSYPVFDGKEILELDFKYHLMAYFVIILQK